MSGCECRVCGYYHPGEGCVIDDALVSKLARERDEARAEVERLRETNEAIKRITKQWREDAERYRRLQADIMRAVEDFHSDIRVMTDAAMREGE